MVFAMSEGTRALATVEQITDLSPIDGADQIEVAHVKGWEAVVRKGEFTAGDAVVFIEPDAMLDVTDPRFAFLASRGVRTDAEGRTGHVLRTARLRGQYSQGLVLSLSEFPEIDAADTLTGSDVTDLLGIVQWEPPVPASLSGQVKGTRPSWIPKTDEERLQNVKAILDATAPHGDPVGWQGTCKIDGSSMTAYVDADGTFGVCSRNQDLVEVEGNTFWGLARKLDLEELLRELAATSLSGKVAVQGEAFGEGIQGNPLKIKGQRFGLFNVLMDGAPVMRQDWPVWAFDMSVPVLDLPFPTSFEEAVKQADNLMSAITPSVRAEGIVWRADTPYVRLPSRTISEIWDGDDGMMVTLAEPIEVPGKEVRGSFKIISRRYALKHDQ